MRPTCTRATFAAAHCLAVHCLTCSVCCPWRSPLPVLLCAARRDGTAKVGDVGMAKILQGGYVSGAVGTLAW